MWCTVNINFLAENRDPIVKILGPGFATTNSDDSTVMRMVEKVGYINNNCICDRIMIDRRLVDIQLVSHHSCN